VLKILLQIKNMNHSTIDTSYQKQKQEYRFRLVKAGNHTFTQLLFNALFDSIGTRCRENTLGNSKLILKIRNFRCPRNNRRKPCKVGISHKTFQIYLIVWKRMLPGQRRASKGLIQRGYLLTIIQLQIYWRSISSLIQVFLQLPLYRMA